MIHPRRKRGRYRIRDDDPAVARTARSVNVLAEHIRAGTGAMGSALCALVRSIGRLLVR